MRIDRRRFLRWSAAAGAAGAVAGARPASAQRSDSGSVGSPGIPAAIRALSPMTNGIVPIPEAERAERIEKARRLMVENGLGAILLEPGSSLLYFTGFRNWWLSERPFVAVLPARGEIAYVCPAFEESRARELMRSPSDIRAWQEDESPYRLIAGILKDRGIATGRVGLEERMRFFVLDGVRREAPALEYAEAVPVTAGCRMIKSPAEIALMQRANDITIAAYRAAFTTMKEGMTSEDLARNVSSAYTALGVRGDADVSFGIYTAFPHGSIQPQRLEEGDVVLVDGGCAVEGYKSDITRTTVFGKPTQRQRDVWNVEKEAQAAAFRAAKAGVPCEDVDAAARKVITAAGFGPDYKVPGLPHRTGHGIGLDGHEWTNFVRGNRTLLAPGMCFSDEPTIAIPGEFGVRLEDCLYITGNGAKFFSEPSPAIDQPFGPERSS
jgi:Xaa-Pro dipeptidase